MAHSSLAFGLVAVSLLSGVRIDLMGYLVGAIRYHVFEKLCIFDVLSAMSKGLEAATPKK